MLYVDGSTAVDPKTHFYAGLKDLIRLDQVRFINIVGSIQYGMLYCILYLFIGIGLHYMFPPLVKGDSLLNVFLWIILQSIIIIIVVFYTEKLVQTIPGILSFFPGYFDIAQLKQTGFKPYTVQEYKGNMAASIVLIGTQFRLLEKISYFTMEFVKCYM